jgi:leucyl-tRNA synthetase
MPSASIYHRRKEEETMPAPRKPTPKHSAFRRVKPLTSEQARVPGYDFAAIEAKWRARWEEQRLYQVDLKAAPRPYYNLMMFPYPSAEGLHVGNMYSFIGSDIHGRWMSMRGYDVFEPIGFDAFGIHSENFAIKRGVHPRILTAHNVEHFREQLKRTGNRFDWSHEVQTTDPRYYRWTQWIFVQLFKHGLAERKHAPVNWCPKDKTVLADEQVINGLCERCDTPVERRWLEQWFLKITNYAQRLLDDMDELDWSERVKAVQRNWIGRSEGLEFSMEIADRPGTRVVVFTTRPDTIFGMTFVALAPQHPLIEAITTEDQRTAVAAYQRSINRLRTSGEQAVTGVFTGAHALHPLTGERVPIWIADFVLEDYGSGAVMGVPAHDRRDLAFAQAMDLPVKVVVIPSGARIALVTGTLSEAFVEPGTLIASGSYTGMSSAEAASRLIAHFAENGKGKRVARYRLRDWLISRQRYWGPPIPIIYCPEHGPVPVPEDQLPVILPETENWMPTGTGVSPLAAIESFVNTTCPICGRAARRETDVSDNFLDSAWYFLRYLSSDDEARAWDPEMLHRWLPVDMYIGGAEHSVLHLMYVRFLTLALHDMGYLEFTSPFKRFRANGMITKDGAKISKSRGNMINPDDYLARYGADIFRTYLVFMGPFEADRDFSDRNLSGAVRFLNRVWSLFTHQTKVRRDRELQGEERSALHRLIKHVTDDLTELKYNTAVAALMAHLKILEARQEIAHEELRVFLQLLAPFAPYITEELWEQLGRTGSIHASTWPEYDPDALQPATLLLPVQINGRTRGRLLVPRDTPVEEIKRLALAAPQAQKCIGGQTTQNVIYVPGRLVNIVTK